ncbi:MAG: hypothetical protein BBJ57_01830 [Desulfobacterales bacterium PC51MH44]|nr:MAG: hypothetical protein BBJ57_01830 [Desulfobacterales bacterium PC51MH44]
MNQRSYPPDYITEKNKEFKKRKRKFLFTLKRKKIFPFRPVMGGMAVLWDFRIYRWTWRF